MNNDEREKDALNRMRRDWFDTDLVFSQPIARVCIFSEGERSDEYLALSDTGKIAPIQHPQYQYLEVVTSSVILDRGSKRYILLLGFLREKIVFFRDITPPEK